VELGIEDDSGRLVPDGEVGEIVTRGPTFASGTREELNPLAASMQRVGTGRAISEHRTGMLDHSRSKKWVIARGGTKIDPHAVENGLRSVGFARDIAVIEYRIKCTASACAP